MTLTKRFKLNLIEQHPRAISWFSLIILFGVVADQATKAWARASLVDNPVLIGETNIGFSLAFNSGSAFSLFQGSTLYITIAGVCIAVVLVVVILRSADVNTSLAYCLIVTGALGNLVDRFTQPPGFAQGYVTDFIKVGGFPTFNIADSLITLGVITLIFFSFKNSVRSS